MAIIIEEEKNRANYTGWLGWVAILAVVVVAAYYLIFTAPPPAAVTPPAGFAALAPLAEIHVDASGVVGSRAFQSLKQSVPEPTSTGPGAVGRANPFVAP